MNYNFEEMTLRQKLSRRGGGVEISLSSLGWDAEMTAYQNYLGGGMIGKICNDCTIPDWELNRELVDVAEKLRKYFYSIMKAEFETSMSSYETIQARPLSAY